MAERAGWPESAGDSTTVVSARADPDEPSTREAQARFEHDVAALELSEAEQRTAWAEHMGRQGDEAESARLTAEAELLYASAEHHHRRAVELWSRTE